MYKTALAQWLHIHFPFAAILATQEIGRRPVMTRILENIIVGLIGGAAAAYVAIDTMQAVHSTQIDDIKHEISQEHQDTLLQIQGLQAQISNIQVTMMGKRFAAGEIK